MSGVEGYLSRPLDDSKQEIRLIKLHQAASFDAPLQISIFHVPFESPQDSSTDIYAPQPSLEEVQRYLPQEWWAHQTIEGRFVFENGYGPVPTRVTYEHSNPDFEHAELLLVVLHLRSMFNANNPGEKRGTRP